MRPPRAAFAGGRGSSRRGSAVGRRTPRQPHERTGRAVAQFPGRARPAQVPCRPASADGDTVGALADAAEAVDPRSHRPGGQGAARRPDAGTRAARRRGRLPHRGGGGRPGNPAYRQGLAAAQEACGDADAALATLVAGIAGAPSSIELRNAAILLSVRAPTSTARAACRGGACRRRGRRLPFGLMGHALSSLGRHAEAAEAYAEALKLGPDDPYVRHLVAASGILPSAARAPVEYLRAVFDGYADRFELHLISLGYRVPGLIRAALARHPPIAGRRASRAGARSRLRHRPRRRRALRSADRAAGRRRCVTAHAAGRRGKAALRRIARGRPDELPGRRHTSGSSSSRPTCWSISARWGRCLPPCISRLEPGGWFMFSVEELLPGPRWQRIGRWRLGAAAPGPLRAQLRLCGRTRRERAGFRRSGFWNVRRCASRRTARLPGSSSSWSARRMTAEAALELLRCR